jgi:diacylglycerol O-acyltransferase / wax synthase
MIQLSGLDASFFYSESPTMFGHVGSLYFLDPATAPEPLTFERIRASIAERLHLVPLYRRRVVMVPMGLDHPYWLEDPDFDLDNHLFHIALPKPGTDRQLADLVARLAAQHLDRTRPLWELWVIEGHHSGYVAHYSKVHHAAIDGVSGAQLLTASFDTEATPAKVCPPEVPWQAEAVPTEAEMLGRALGTLANQPAQLARLHYEAVRSLPGLRQSLPSAEALASLPSPQDLLFRPADSAPVTPLNRPITSQRSWAFGSLSLSTVKDIKNAFCVTVNDVVMAVCGGALRAWLLETSHLPEEPLIAMLPVSVRTSDQAGTLGNRISVMMASLGTHLDDPVARLHHVHASTLKAKEQHQAIPAHLLTDAAQFSSPALAALASQMSARFRSTGDVKPSFNVTVSNIPGQRQSLWSLGARLVSLHPVSTIMDYHGLNLTVQSYCDQLDVGLIADRKMVPNLWQIMTLLEQALDELAVAAKAAA